MGRRELDGWPTDASLPRYRRVSAPIYGVAMQHGAAVYQKIVFTDLPDSHRTEVTRRDEALGLDQGVVALETAVQADPRTVGSPQSILRPALPDATTLTRLMPPRADGLTFSVLFWRIESEGVQGVLNAIRAEAEAKLDASPVPTPAATTPGIRNTRKQMYWTIVGAVVGVICQRPFGLPR